MRTEVPRRQMSRPVYHVPCESSGRTALSGSLKEPAENAKAVCELRRHAAGMLVFQMSRCSFQVAPSRFQITKYLPRSATLPCFDARRVLPLHTAPPLTLDVESAPGLGMRSRQAA